MSGAALGTVRGPTEPSVAPTRPRTHGPAARSTTAKRPEESHAAVGAPPM